MNTPMDTDEGRPRPSVWPVYVATAVVLLISVSLSSSGARLCVSTGEDLLYPLFFVFQFSYGLFGVLAGIGMALLRPWGWWGAVVFAGIWTIYGGAACGIAGLFFWPPRSGFAVMMGLFVIASWLGPTILLVSVLTTRRRLFFPPKPEDDGAALEAHPWKPVDGRRGSMNDDVDILNPASVVWMWIRTLIPVWRILATLAVFELLGGGIVQLIGFHYSAFTNFSLGGGIAAPLGFLVGLLWHLSDQQRRKGTEVEVVVFIGILAVGLGAVTLMDGLPSSTKEMDSLAVLQSLPDGSIERILVYDKYGDEFLMQIDNKSALSSFVLACRNIKGYFPNHPTFTESWYLVLQGDNRTELQCHYQQGYPDKVVGDCVQKTGSSMGYFGTFISSDLRPWFEQHIEGGHR